MKTSLRGLPACSRQLGVRLIVGAAMLLSSQAAWAAAPRAKTPSRPANGSFEIPATEFDRGNVKIFTDQYADAGPMVAYGGESPIVVEYDINFPVDGSYTVHIRYAAAQRRPVEVSVDETKLGDCCRQVTGGWNTSKAGSDSIRTEYLTPGKHTFRLQRSGAFPHVISLRFEASDPFPAGWKLTRTAKQQAITTVKYTGPVATDVKPEAMRLAIRDLMGNFPAAYPQGAEYLRRLDELEGRLKVLDAQASPDQNAAKTDREQVTAALESLRREALLANPLLDFDRLLLVRRPANAPALGLPRNWQSNCSLAPTGFDDQIDVLSLSQKGRTGRPSVDTIGGVGRPAPSAKRRTGRPAPSAELSPTGGVGRAAPSATPAPSAEADLTTLYKPGKKFVGDVDLHFNADRMLFSMPGDSGRWQVFEIRADGSSLRQLTGQQPDVDNYDACYLPSGKIAFTSTAYFVGVPCVYGGSHVANLYVMDGDGQSIRQICFDQEHDWCPTVLANGRLLYARWEYADTPHAHTRLLFHANPDGTEQFEFYKSNSYWPNSMFYARPVPGHPTKVAAVIGGHHDNPRMGELVIFDPAKGRYEDTGAVQRIPGYGQKVEAVIRDGLTLDSWPKFLHPYPLSEKYFLTAAKPTPTALWGIYLVDAFDNMVLLKELPGHALLEPIPLRRTPVPPVIPDKVDLAQKDAVVYIPDIYAGPGLKGVPRGTVKQLRLFTYHYAYQGMGGLLGVVGVDGPWDVKRIMGTVPVHPDGSTKFRIPANTPISLQPLDDEGKAIQLMRSWMTAMPGEVVQCSGCHEPQNTAPPLRTTLAVNQQPAAIEPWHGPMRGFSYAREVQPVIDKHCVGCHDGSAHQGRTTIDLRGDRMITDFRQVSPGTGGARGGRFSVGYAELHRFVRRPGIESDYHLLEPMEFHADTTELVQMLKKGHYGVSLDAEGWDRLITWIDLNCPFHGNWLEATADPGIQRQRRRELLKLYANVDDDPEALAPLPSGPVAPIVPPQPAVEPPLADCPGWPFDAAEAQRRQKAAGPAVQRTIDLGGGQQLSLTLVPAGRFVMGSLDGAPDERPMSVVAIDRPFWMGRFEVTNAQYARFDPKHDSRIESKNSYQFGVHGYPMNQPEQPVVRVAWDEAMAFCRWLSDRTNLRVSLPSEAQWEYACRAGTATPMYYGDAETDFAGFANLADTTITKFASNPYTVDEPLRNPTKYDDWIPKDARFNDGSLLSVKPGVYRPNAWGLFDMHGNVAEWTSTTYGPYPVTADHGGPGSKVVRGGSWYDRPYRAASGFRLSHQPYQRVFNVGFRVVCHIAETQMTQASVASGE